MGEHGRFNVAQDGDKWPAVVYAGLKRQVACKAKKVLSNRRTNVPCGVS